MLLLSYILTASLELAIVYMSVKSSSWALVWAYGFLLAVTLFSVHAEDSRSGKLTRGYFRSLGISSESYDLASNLLKALIYILVITGVISYYLGAFLAYLVVFVVVALVIYQYMKILRKKEEEEDQEKEGKNKEE